MRDFLRAAPWVGRMATAWRRHWPYYTVEAVELAVFISCASVLAVVVEHPASPVRQALGGATTRRAVQGILMGLVVVGTVYSPWGKRSGAYMNPALTLAFWQMGKISGPDAIWYSLAQVAGAIGAAQFWALVLGTWYAHPVVHYATTKPLPRPGGELLAFAAEFVISFLLIVVVLGTLHCQKLKKRTGWVLGGLIACYIIVEAPLSGMSLNPARSLGPALVAGDYHGLWLYCVAPPLAMWLATVLFRRFYQGNSLACAALAGCGPDAMVPHYPQAEAA